MSICFVDVVFYHRKALLFFSVGNLTLTLIQLIYPLCIVQEVFPYPNIIKGIFSFLFPTIKHVLFKFRQLIWDLFLYMV